MGHSGIIDQNIDRSSTRNLCEHISDVLLIGNIAERPLGFSPRLTNLPGSRFCVALIDFNDVNECSGLGEADRDRPTTAARSACNDSIPAVQPEYSRIVAVSAQGETPRFLGMKLSCPSSSALVFNSPFQACLH